ncbi:hypothetical protein E2562_005668 [Oryza meyeriana var. granulata]|uniref:Uncharacterized protein n=1 Tax=Oryza meyeriana var. granulata TaxID=110450 RepID=A0A6G1F469_9ORYZ|nr:hypothetical protein E2562_005668 [Oryza meyeriana var. granulata]
MHATDGNLMDALQNRLDRRNAAKNIGYDATLFCSYPQSPPASSVPACSLDLTSFRIGGSGDGSRDVQLLCSSLGLSGADDFSIPLANWEKHKAGRSPCSPSTTQPHDGPPARDSPLCRGAAEEPARPPPAVPVLPAKETPRDAAIEAPAPLVRVDPWEPARPDVKKASGEGGIKAVRSPPLVLKPLLSMAARRGLPAPPAPCSASFI